MINLVINYAKSMGAGNEIVNWLGTTGNKYLKKNKIDINELEHIVDYFISDAAPKRLQKMSIGDAKRKANEWMKSNQKKGSNLVDNNEDIEMVFGFEDGSFIAKLKTKKAFQREGYLMNHCLGGYSISNDIHIYSYRDNKNMPHATFEVRKNSDEIVQIKGKGNGDIHHKYIEPVLAFLESLNIKIRPSEMKHLGYYHIDKRNIDYLKQMPNAWKQVVSVNNEYYAV